MNPPEWHPWMDDAACAELPPDDWFPDHGDHWTAARAIDVCQGCAVRELCAEFGMGEIHGIYGGLTPRARAAIRRERAA